MGRSSSSFDIATVSLSGTHLVPEKKTLRLLRRTYAGDNLFTVTAKDVRETLAPLCFVSGVTVDREFPERVDGDQGVRAGGLRPGRQPLVRVDENGYVICTPRPLAAEQAREAGQVARRTPSASASPAPEAGDRRRRPASSPGPGRRAALPLPRIAVTAGCARGAEVLDEAAAEKLAVIDGAAPLPHRRDLAVVEEEEGRLSLRFDDGLVTTWGDAERTLAKTVALRTGAQGVRGRGQECTMMDVSHPGQDPRQAGAPVTVEARFNQGSSSRGFAAYAGTLFDTPRGRG